MFVRVELSVTWPNLLLALLGVINEGVLRGIPPSQQAGQLQERVSPKSDIPPEAKVNTPRERY